MTSHNDDNTGNDNRICLLGGVSSDKIWRRNSLYCKSHSMTLDILICIKTMILNNDDERCVGWIVKPVEQNCTMVYETMITWIGSR